MHKITLLFILFSLSFESNGTAINDSLWSSAIKSRVRGIEQTIFELAKAGNLHSYHKPQSSSPLNPQSLEETGNLELRIANHNGKDSSIELNFDESNFSGIGFFRTISHDLFDGSSAIKLEQISLRYTPKNKNYLLSPINICYVYITEIQKMLSADDYKFLLALDVISKNEISLKTKNLKHLKRNSILANNVEFANEQVFQLNDIWIKELDLYFHLFLESLTTYVHSGQSIYKSKKTKRTLSNEAIIYSSFINKSSESIDSEPVKEVYRIPIKIGNTSEISLLKNNQLEFIIEVRLKPIPYLVDDTDFKSDRVFYLRVSDLLEFQNNYSSIMTHQILTEIGNI